MKKLTVKTFKCLCSTVTGKRQEFKQSLINYSKISRIIRRNFGKWLRKEIRFHSVGLVNWCECWTLGNAYKRWIEVIQMIFLCKLVEGEEVKPTLTFYFVAKCYDPWMAIPGCANWAFGSVAIFANRWMFLMISPIYSKLLIDSRRAFNIFL